MHGVRCVEILHTKDKELIVTGIRERLKENEEIRNIFKINEEVYDINSLSAIKVNGILTIFISKRKELEYELLKRCYVEE